MVVQALVDQVRLLFLKYFLTGIFLQIGSLCHQDHHRPSWHNNPEWDTTFYRVNFKDSIFFTGKFTWNVFNTITSI